MEDEDNPYASPKGMECEIRPWWEYVGWIWYYSALISFCLFFYPLLLLLFLYFDIKEKRPWLEVTWDFIYPLLLWIILIMIISSVFCI